MLNVLKISILFICILSFLCTNAQPRPDSERDKLKTELKTILADSVRIFKLQELSRYYAFKVGEFKVDLDSSYYYAKKSELLSKYLKFNKGELMSLVLYSQIFREGGDNVKGKKYLNKAFAIAKKNKISWLEGEAYRELTNYYPLDNTGSIIRVKYVQKALEAFRKGGSKKQIADILLYYGGHYFLMGKYKEALSKFSEAKLIYQSFGYTNLQNLYSQMFRTYLKLGLYQEAIYYGLVSIKLGEKNKDNFFLMNDYKNLGSAYYYIENYPLALKFHKKAFHHSSIIYKEGQTLYIGYYIINDLLRMGEKSNAKSFLDNVIRIQKIKSNKDLIWFKICHIIVYDDLGWFTLSNKYYNELIAVQEKNKMSLLDASSFEIDNVIINHLLRVKNYELASKYLKKNKKMCLQIKDINLINNNQLMEFKLDSAKGNYLNAISKLKKYEKTRDSVFNEVKAFQIANLQIKYETDKKDNNIKLLENESLLQKIVIEKDRITKSIISLVLLLFLIIIGLLYRRYKNKQISNIALQVKQNEIETTNKSLQKLVNDKEWLLKEIHHRVKNNLQVVMSLLSSQSAYLKDEAAISAIKDSQNRINSMSLIHQRLYNSEDLAVINMTDYIGDLIIYLKDSFNSKLHFVTDIENIVMDVSQATPIGLIINEAVTNSIKYAFPNKEEDGFVKISLKHSHDDYFLLEVTDNGIGIADSIDITNNNSLGLKLMDGFSRDLNGKLSVTKRNGTIVSLIFIYNFSKE